MTSIALALLLGQAATANLTAPVTFEHKAAPIGRVLAKLAETTKLRLEAGPTVENEVVLVSVKEVPTGDLLQKIATVTSAEWRQDGEVWRLTASPGLRNREASDEFAAKVAGIRAAIAERVKRQKEAAKAKPDGAMALRAQVGFGMGMGGGTSPSEVAITSILQGIDPRAIAALGPNERVVFSTQPTRMQRALSGNMNAVIATLVADHNATAKNADALEELDKSPEADKIPQYVRDMIARQTRPIGQVSKGLLVVSRAGFGSMRTLMLEFRLYDGGGKVVYTTASGLPLNAKGRELPMDPSANKPSSTGQTPIALSPETKLFQEAISQGSNMMSVVLKPEAKPLIFHPERHDPLSFFATDSLLSVAKKRKQPIVASLPDEVMNVMALAMGERTTVESVEQDLKDGDTMKVVPDDRFLLIKPSEPASAREGRLDRVALAALMQAVEAKTIPSLDDVANYALKAPSPLEDGIGQVYVMMFAPGAVAQSLSGFTDWEALRFYGMLGADARRTLAGGGRIPFAGLTQAQSAQIRKMAFGTMADLVVDDPNRPKDAMVMPSWMRMFGMGGDPDYRTEPTEIMPNGLPGNGFVSAQVVSDFFVSPVAEGDKPTSGPMAVLGAEEIAILKTLREDLGETAFQIPEINRVRVGQRSTWNFSFHVAPSVSLKTILHDNRLPQGASVVAMSALPAEFQKRIQAKLEEVKKSPLGMLGGMMGGPQVTPP